MSVMQKIKEIEDEVRFRTLYPLVMVLRPCIVNCRRHGYSLLFMCDACFVMSTRGRMCTPVLLELMRHPVSVRIALHLGLAYEAIDTTKLHCMQQSGSRLRRSRVTQLIAKAASGAVLGSRAWAVKLQTHLGTYWIITACRMLLASDVQDPEEQGHQWSLGHAQSQAS